MEEEVKGALRGGEVELYEEKEGLRRLVEMVILVELV